MPISARLVMATIVVLAGIFGVFSLHHTAIQSRVNRKLFDSYVMKIDLPVEQWVILNRSLETKLASIMSEIGPDQVGRDTKPGNRISPPCDRPMVRSARAGARN